MSFNYSYKAFVITILILGNLYLLFYFIKLPSNSIILEEEYEIEYALEEVIPEEELASVSEEEIKNYHRSKEGLISANKGVSSYALYYGNN